MTSHSKKGGMMPETLGGIIITILIVIVGAYFFFMWMGGFADPKMLAKQSARDLADALTRAQEYQVGLTPLGCKEFDMAVFPDYQLVVAESDDPAFRKVYAKWRGKWDPDAKDGAGDWVYPEGPEGQTDILDEIGYRQDEQVGKDVCSPYGLDPSEHTIHCGNEQQWLIINQDWTDKITGTYCVCFVIWGGLEDRISVYPKRGLTCANLVGKLIDEARKAAEANGLEAGEAVIDAYEDVAEGPE